MVAVVAALGLREASVVSMHSPNGEFARVRQSWSARPERVESCRRLSDEELADLPAHMRLRTRCEGGFARYRLTVSIDDSTITVDTLRGGGLRNDRPMHVFEEIRVAPGERRLRLDVTRLDSTSAPEGAGPPQGAAPADTLLGGRAEREADERRRREAEAIPPRLALDTLLTLAPGRVVLVVYDESTRRLRARTGQP